MSSAGLTEGQEPVELPTVRTHLFDPAPELGVLRERRPVCPLRYPHGDTGWLVTNHALAKSVLTDLRFGVDSFKFPIGDPVRWAAVRETFRSTGISAANLLELEPPEHTHYRRLLAAPFSLRRIADYRERVERIVADRLDAMEQAGPSVDLVAVFASPIALATHCALLGVPASDGDRFRRLAEAVATVSDEDVRTSFGDFCDYLRPMIEQKRAEPGDDVMSYIVAQPELSDEEIFSIVSMLFFAGHTSTTGMIALGTFALLYHPDQLQALRDDPSLIDAAVEELLRYLTNLQAGGMTRRALEDIELGGIMIKEGECVTVSLAAANRDAGRFNHPDALDLHRSATGHLAFGQGAHMCLGQHIARLEIQLALARLIERFPALRLAVPPEDVPVSAGDQLDYTVYELPVTW